MRNEVFKGKIACRIDVDYPRLAPGAVPYMLDVLDSYGSKATFFVTTGISKKSLSASSLINVQYLLRLFRLRAWNLLSIASGACSLSDLVAQISGRGHEVAIHGYDHRWWMENIWTASIEDIEHDIESAYGELRKISGACEVAWGSPGWRTNAQVLDILAGKSVKYFSECWGSSPFITRLQGRRWKGIPHLPITLPSLETLVVCEKLVPADAVQKVLDRPADRYDMFVCHDYYEGDLRRDLFRLFLEEVDKRGWRTVSLSSIASEIQAAGIQLPECGLRRGPVEGFVGDVSWQDGVE